MVKKLAIFVEGLTEQFFIIKLLKEIAGNKGITLEIKKQYMGALSVVNIESHPNPDYHILVVNCCNEDQVKSQINDRYDSLKTAGYSLIIGIRDIFPLQHSDIPILEHYLLHGLPTDTVPIQLHLAILEVEAWFLEELTHYKNIDPALTEINIVSNGFNYHTQLASDLLHPAKTLDDIYKSVGKRYKKKKNQIERTVNALSYEEMYVSVRAKAPSFDRLLTGLEQWLF